MLCLVSLLMLTWTQGQGQDQGLDVQGQGQDQGLDVQGQGQDQLLNVQGQDQGLKPQGQDQDQGLQFCLLRTTNDQGQHPFFLCDKIWTVYCTDTVGSLCSGGWSSIWCSYWWCTLQPRRSLYIQSAFIIVCNCF